MDPAGARRAVELAASADKQLRMYEQCYHELFNEPEQDEILGVVCEWIAARTA